MTNAEYLPMMEATLSNGVTTHHGHTPEITFASASEASAIWAMHDYVQVDGPDGRVSIKGWGHYHETYRKGDDGRWRINSKRNSRLHVDEVPWTLPSRDRATIRSGHHDGKQLVAAHVCVVHELRVLEVGIPLREALEQFFEHDASFEACERLTQAVVRAEAEGEVVTEVASDVQPVGIGEVPFVAVPGGRQRHHAAPGRYHLPVVLDVLNDVPTVLQCVGLEAPGSPRRRSVSAPDPRRATVAGPGTRSVACPCSRSGSRVVSFPAAAMMLTYARSSSRVNRRSSPASFSNSAFRAGS